MARINTRLWILASASCLALVPLPGAAVPAVDPGPISRIIVFGDSYSDAGGPFGSQAISSALLQPRGPVAVDPALWQAVVPDTVHYWSGHWSNGPTAVEVLADRLRIPLLDYAVGGAMTGAGNYYGWMDAHVRTGVLGQLERYRATLQPAAADPDALYVIEACGNDFFHAIDAQVVDSRTPPLAPAQVTALADGAVANIETAVRGLQALGARRVLVFGSPDIALLPWAQGHNFQSLGHGPVRFVAEAQRFSARVNARLGAQLPALGATLHLQITYFDLAAAGAAIRTAAPANGLRNLTEACQPGGATGTFTAPCNDPDSYFFWDEYHPTRRASQLTAAALAQALFPTSPAKVLP